MAKRRIKAKIFKFVLVLILIGIIFCIYYFIIGDDISRVQINNNYILSEKEILELSKLDNYPSFLFTTKTEIAKNLKKSVLISDVKVSKRLGKLIVLDITENRILFKNSNNSKYVLSNYIEDVFDEEYDVPILLNYVPDEIYKELIEKMSGINNNIIQKISEIKYSPNEYDDDLFILYMNDQNVVHVTLDKFTKLNKYNDIVVELEGDKGILYLDSGDYFKIMN